MWMWELFFSQRTDSLRYMQRFLNLSNACKTPASSQCLWPTIEINSSFQHPQLKTLKLRERSVLSRVSELVCNSQDHALGSILLAGAPVSALSLHHLCSALAEDHRRYSELHSSVSCNYLARCDSQLGDSALACPIKAGNRMYRQEMGPPDSFVIWPWSSMGQ